MHPPTTESTLRFDARKASAPVSPTLFGLFFEDINFACDGGLNANLVANYSFDGIYGEGRGLASFGDRRPSLRRFDRTRHWEIAGGTLESRQDEPAAPGAWFARIRSDRRATLSNPGHPGGSPAMPIRPGVDYHFRALLRGRSFEGELEARLIDAAGSVLARAALESPTAEWGRYSARLRPTAGGPASLQLVFDGVGAIDIDEVRLVPADHWKAGDPRWSQGVLRRDLVEAIRDLSPRFMRFPGGCIVEGSCADNAYDWKKTVGPLERRGSDFNLWSDFRPEGDYSQSFEIGFYEYFLLCEDLGMKPMPILPAGIGCQMRFDHVCDLESDEFARVIQSAIDLIDWATGDPEQNEWAALRAQAGHPDPFPLELLGIGNENFGADYLERFDRIKDAVDAHRPGLTFVLSAGPFPEGEAFEAAMQHARKLGSSVVVDEHFYGTPEWVTGQIHRYDAHDRTGPRIFLGEWAAHPPRLLGMAPQGGEPNEFASALAEAAFLTGVERNADVVVLTSYAPLFRRLDACQWMHNLIDFTSTEVVRTANYHVQRLFATTVGEWIVPMEGALPEKLHVSCTSTNGALSIKLVNLADEPVPLRLELPGTSATFAAATLLRAELRARNDLDEAGRPRQEVRPATSRMDLEGDSLALELPSGALVVLSLTA